MLNKAGQRELCYLVKIDKIKPIAGSDNCEAAVIGGWEVMVRKSTFTEGAIAIYFEIDSKVDISRPEFAFMRKYSGKVKTQKYTFGGKGLMYSQGLLMSPRDFNWTEEPSEVIELDGTVHSLNDESRFLTKKLNVIYAVEEDNARKAADPDKYAQMMNRHKKLFSYKPIKWLMKYNFGRKIMFFFFGRKKANKKGWPVGRFPGVAKTDQERVENMPQVLNNKIPFIITQKCDGSSATYILEKKLFGYEFYVLSRNVRQLTENQECYHATNVYWELAKKYDIEKKMRQYLKETGAWFVCWQGEATGPSTQGNPHKLEENHLFCFHATDSINGRLDIREAKKIWDKYGMETVPIITDEYIMPDDFEAFKKSADGYYDESVVGKGKIVRREGFVYYSTIDPTFSFKNVSREYLIKHR